MQGAPIFSKIELWVKKSGVSKLEYTDSSMIITGNYLIIAENGFDDDFSTVTSTGTLFDLSDIVRYKTHSK